MQEILLMDFLNGYDEKRSGGSIIVYDENTKELSRLDDPSKEFFTMELLQSRCVYQFWFENGNLCLMTSLGV